MNYKIELRYGILVGVLGFVWLLAEYFSGLHGKYIRMHSIITNFEIIIPIIILPLGIRAKKRIDYNNNINYWNALQSGIIMSLISGTIAVLGVLIYYKAINPGWYEFMIETSKQMAAEKKMSIKEAEEFAKMYFSMTSYMTQALFGAITIGAFISLIASYFIKSKKAIV